MGNPNINNVLNLYRDYQETIILDVFSSTIQFFRHDEKGNPKAFGTGVLIKIENQHFVFTAAHVIDKEQSDLWVPSDNDQFLRLGGQYITNSHPNRKNDDIDVGIIILTPSTANLLETRYKFVSIDEIQIDHRFNERQEYVVVGYPATKTKSNFATNKLVSRPFKYITAPGASNRYKRMNCDPNHRVLVHYDRSSVLNLKTGRTQKGPNSHGMSGCGFWHVPLNGFAQETGEKKLVAILTDWPNNNWWIGTKIEIFTEIIRQRLNLNIPIPKNVEVTISSE